MNSSKINLSYTIIAIVLASTVYYYINKSERKFYGGIIDFKAFEVKVPENWRKIELNGIDSYVGGITNGIHTLTFDYGMYSYDFKSENKATQLFATDTINGKIALITKPKKAGNGTLGIYIENAYKQNKFNLIGENIYDEKTILNIFKTLKFKDSDTLKNSKKIEFSNKITPYSEKYLFKVNCASCHHKYKRFIGPAFSELKEGKIRKWLLDSTDIKIKDTFEFGTKYHREKFGKRLTKNEIKKLIQFSKTE
jgi:hypothetical protein